MGLQREILRGGMKPLPQYLPASVRRMLRPTKAALTAAGARVLQSIRAKSAEFGLEWAEDDRRLLGLRNIHAGQRAFLLGNGPSVRREDLELMKGDIVFAANRFHLAYKTLRVRPTYTVCVDLLVLDRHGAEIVRECGTPLFVTRRFKRVGDIRDHKTIVLRETQEVFSENPEDFLFSSNPVRTVGFGYGVIFTMIQLAVWMGIRRLLLYGIDHTFKLPPDYCQPGVPVTHQGEDNHFIPNYRDAGEKWAPPNPRRTEAAFACARSYCESHGIEIYNCTRGGRLQTFERRSIDEELAIKGGRIEHIKEVQLT